MCFSLLEQFKNKILIKELCLCDLLLEDKKLPWVLLVPRRENVEQVNHLKRTDQLLLLDEIDKISNVMEKLFPCDRLNVAAIGNKTPQLHVHIICRTKDDECWPDTVWGRDLEILDLVSQVDRAQLIRSLC